MAPKKEEKSGGLGVVGAIIITVLQFAALVLMALGTPYDVLKLNHLPTFPSPRCYSVWGMKQCGGSHPATWHDTLYRTCGVFEACMKAAASFCCVSLFAILLAILVSVAYSCKALKSKVPIILALLLGVVSTSIPWAVIAGLYHNRTCSYGRFKDTAKYAPGFALFVASWGVTVLSFIIAVMV